MIYLIYGGNASGKTTKLKEVYSDIGGFGFVSEKVIRNDKIIGYDLVSLDNSAVYPFIRLNDESTFSNKISNKRFSFNLDVISQVERDFGKSISNVLYFDEIGALELVKRQGFYKWLLEVIKQDVDLYLTINHNNLNMILPLIKEYQLFKVNSVGAIIMASGESVRYGNENKLLVNIDGKSIFEYTLESVMNADAFSEIVVVTCYQEIKDICNKYPFIKVADNPNYKEGISGSIRNGINKLSDYLDGYAFIPADQPLVSKQSYQTICNLFKENLNKIIIPVFGNKTGSPKVFSKYFKSELLTLTGDNGGRQIVKNNMNLIEYLQIENHSENIDVDTNDDIEKVKRVLM